MHDRTAGALALAALLWMGAGAACAGQANAPFSVSVSLQKAGAFPDSAFCRMDNLPGAFGATITVVCSTGVVVDVSPSRPGPPLAPMHGGAYRYLTQVSAAGQILGTVDIYSGLGTITSWRVVRLVDREYVEMTLNW
jgi:hypothetical protein